MADQQQPTQEQTDQRDLERVFFLSECGVLSHQQAVAALVPIAARIWDREMSKRALTDEEQPF